MRLSITSFGPDVPRYFVTAQSIASRAALPKALEGANSANDSNARTSVQAGCVCTGPFCFVRLTTVCVRMESVRVGMDLTGDWLWSGCGRAQWNVGAAPGVITHEQMQRRRVFGDLRKTARRFVKAVVRCVVVDGGDFADQYPGLYSPEFVIHARFERDALPGAQRQRRARRNRPPHPIQLHGHIAR